MGKPATKVVFLGGTCGNNTWRDQFIKDAIAKGVPEAALFNPVVKDWNEDAGKREELAKASADCLLFYIADPQVPGINLSAYSLVEATMALYDKPSKTVVVFDSTGQHTDVIKNMTQAAKVLKARFPEANIFDSLDDALAFVVKI